MVTPCSCDRSPKTRWQKAKHVDMQMQRLARRMQRFLSACVVALDGAQKGKLQAAVRRETMLHEEGSNGMLKRVCRDLRRQYA